MLNVKQECCACQLLVFWERKKCLPLDKLLSLPPKKIHADFVPGPIASGIKLPIFSSGEVFCGFKLNLVGYFIITP